MAKSKKKIEARNLRKNGLSIKEIAEKIKVSKSSVSIWCADIELTKGQIEKLYEQMVRGGYSGRLKGARIQRENKKKKIRYFSKKGKHDIKQIKKRELFMAGLALYWGEGSKKDPRVRFYNSDPKIIGFIMKWFREILNIAEDRFIMYVTINRIHKERLNDVCEYWSKITNIPTKQFRKPILIKAKNEKIYENYFQHYGTLCIRITKSSELFYQIMGWLNALGSLK